MAFHKTLYPAGFDYQSAFTELRQVAAMEGGQVYFGRAGDSWCAVTDESYWADFLGPDDLICVRLFMTQADLAEWPLPECAAVR
jgi:hypothetical protein